ncbi:MAG: DNA repair protein RecO [Peptoniphilaceae bacterium]|nr:DNA repair protein RecO [Peptoniphilaceae bacterium]MDY6085163.1 DNA repair protein RecO [Peptoniphilaceae bacterium]
MDEAKNLEGIVLQSYPVRDSSRMVELFTRAKGRVSFMARGAKRDKSRFLNLSEPYVEGTFELVSGRSAYYIKNGVIENAHLGLRQSVGRLCVARFATEVLLGVLVDQPEEELYALYAMLLAVLEETPEERLSHVAAAYVLKLVSFAGFRPVLGRCAHCGKPVRLGEGFWDAEAGGVVDADHRAPTARRLSAADHATLVRYIREPLRAILTPYGSTEGDGRRLLGLCFGYYGVHTGRSVVSSLHMMKRLSLL